jgi:AcrR family transcriptional regulator
VTGDSAEAGAARGGNARPVTRGRQPMRPPTPAHRDKLETIKAVAAEHFYTQGYAATDLRGIAASADMHVTSLYNYISGKQQLLYMIMRDGMDGIISSLVEAVDGVEDPVARLSKGLRSHVLHHAQRRHLAWISHVELRSLTGENRKKILRLRRDYEARWKQMVQDGMDAGVVMGGDPGIVVYGLLAVGQSVSRWYEATGRVSEEEMSDTMVKLMLHGLIRTDS